MLTSAQQMREKFLAEYARLNPEQKEAVDAIEGPVMVVAGPGTGKTQILASRIARILLETQVSPQNILCLTYTDAGTVAMRKRLVYFLGTEAYKVNIHTFHSFCNKVIQENTRQLKKQDLEPLSDLERVQYIKELIDGFDNDSELKRFKGEVYYDLQHLARLFSDMKREAWEPEMLQQKIDHYIGVTIPENFTNKKNKEKGLTQKGQEQVERMMKTKAAVSAFDQYQSILASRNRYDFDDMIKWVIRLFEQHPEVLLGYQEQLQYILVDEYQDTSGSQNKIVEMLTSYWEDNPNLFVVGDDDQSIYRFQGANVENMMAIRTRLEKNLKTVVLNANYRSVQPILDAARELISKNKKRLINQVPGLTKNLTAARPELKDLNILPCIRMYENEFSENAHIALSVKALIDSGTPAGKIAIIYREHKFGDELQKFLHLAGIPFYVKKSLDLLNDHFISRILNIIKYFIAEDDKPYSGEYLLFEMMHYDFFEMEPLTIARITNEVYENQRRKKGPQTLREYINAVDSKQSGLLFPTDETSAELGRIGALLNMLQKDANNLPLQQWFEKLVNEAGILAYIMQHDEKIWLMEKLSCLFDYIKDETHRNPLCTARDFIHLTELMMDNDLRLPLIQTTGNETGVNLLSCHGSKGLEFEHVFLLGARSDIWEEKRKRNNGFSLPPSVFEGGDERSALTEEDHQEELRRLFYVSITRAEKHLYLSYPRMKNDGKELIPSGFVEDIRLALNLETEFVTLDDEMKFRFQSLRFGLIRKPVLQQAEKDYIDGILSTFVMNVTALNNYIDCPLKFYFNTLVKVPGAKSEHASFGSAVHEALKQFYDNSKLHSPYPTVEFFIEQFNHALQKEREVFTAESYGRFKEHGSRVLTAYYNHKFKNKKAENFILNEYRLDNVSLNDVPLKGFADLITFYGNDIIITDFKTGDPARARAQFKRPGEDEKKPEGGNYWRQAVFYKLMVDRLPKNWKVQHAEFEFIEPDKKNKFDTIMVNISPEDEQKVALQITDAWEKIRKHDFYTGCGKEDCEWCRFSRDNRIYSRLIEEEAEKEELI